MKEEFSNEVVRLPLWKSCLDNIRNAGVVYGQTFTAEYFEKQLRVTRDSMQFGLAISEIRRELEKDGFYLSGRGQKGNQFVILPAESNADVMQHYSRAALDALKRGVILGTNTRLDTLSVQDRRKHESTLEKMAIRVSLMRRSHQIYKAVKSTKPELLEDLANRSAADRDTDKLSPPVLT